MKELDQKRAEALAWGYFRVILPVSREKLKDKYKEASDRMDPKARPSNTKGEFMEMRNFYHDLLEANPSWAFTAYEAPRTRRPNRGSNRVGFKPGRNSQTSEPLMKAFSVLLPR
jgi:hypothetical protein